MNSLLVYNFELYKKISNKVRISKKNIDSHRLSNFCHKITLANDISIDIVARIVGHSSTRMNIKYACDFVMDFMQNVSEKYKIKWDLKLGINNPKIGDKIYAQIDWILTCKYFSLIIFLLKNNMHFLF